jgi:hypothetical protein
MKKRKKGSLNFLKINFVKDTGDIFAKDTSDKRPWACNVYKELLKQ